MASKPTFANQLDKYAIHEVIGEGAFGKVCRATRVEDNKEFAVKCLKIKNIKNSNMIKTVKKEVKVMQMLPLCKHCVNMIEVLQSDTYVYIVVELVKGGQLFDRIQNHPDKRLPENIALPYFQQIIAGLEFLHGEKIVHRDLKLENILVHEEGYVMISDFGLSGTRKNIKELKDVAGSPRYVAPEIISGRGYDGYAADIWSCGVILYALLAGFLPFEDDDFKKLFKKIVDCDPEFPKWFSVTAVHLLAKIFVVDPKSRITLNQIKDHAFYLGISASMPNSRGSKVRFSLASDLNSDNIIPNSIPALDIMRSMQRFENTPELQIPVNDGSPAMSDPAPNGVGLQHVMTDYGEEDVEAKDGAASPKEKLTFFDIVGLKFHGMMTNVLRRQSSVKAKEVMPKNDEVDANIDGGLRSKSAPSRASLTAEPPDSSFEEFT